MTSLNRFLAFAGAACMLCSAAWAEPRAPGSGDRVKRTAAQGTATPANAGRVGVATHQSAARRDRRDLEAAPSRDRPLDSLSGPLIGSRVGEPIGGQMGDTAAAMKRAAAESKKADAAAKAQQGSIDQNLRELQAGQTRPPPRSTTRPCKSADCAPRRAMPP